MPIYEYRCATCGFQKEYLQKVSDPKLTDCPECGKPTFDKMLTAAGFHLKGSGWYVTDFRDSGAKPKDGVKAKSANKDTPAAAESKKEEKSEPAAPAASASASGSGTTPAST